MISAPRTVAIRHAARQARTAPWNSTDLSTVRYIKSFIPRVYIMMLWMRK